MKYLLEIEFRKIKNYRTFVVIVGMYFLCILATTASGMEFLKWMKRLFSDFGGNLNINRIPLYHFPDIWQNLIWVSGVFKIVLGIWVIITITNEFQYRTIRQNIIDGMSRWEFLGSKIVFNVLLSLASVVMIGLVAFTTGLIYSPEIIWEEVFTDVEFLPAYFLEVFSFLSYALLLGVLIMRSGLAIVVLLLSNIIERIIKANVDNYSEFIIQFFPMESISNLVPLPFARYAFQQIQDDVSLVAVTIGIGWIIIFNFLSYNRLKNSDL